MGKKLVNACGTALEAWEVDINGTIGDAHGGECPAGGTCGQAKSFDLLFDSATQYGGFFVADRLIEAGTDAGTGQSYYYAIGAEIEQAPVHPKQ
jgi:hypothetical protein